LSMNSGVRMNSYPGGFLAVLMKKLVSKKFTICKSIKPRRKTLLGVLGFT